MILTVLYANHKSGLVEIIQTILAGVNLSVVWTLSFKYKSAMFLVTSIVYSILPLLLLLIINLVCFKTIFEKIKPSLRFVNSKLFNDIMGLGAKFLLLQLAYVVIFSTDNYLIAKFFNVSEVTVYTTHYKLFSIIPVITGIFYNVLWSPITDAMARGDKDWLKLKLKQIKLIMIILFVISLVLLAIGPIFMKYWTLSKVSFSFILSFICAVYVLIMGWNTMFGLFANASSKVKLQVYLSFAAMILNIPICIYLIRETTLGIYSIPIAGIICMLPGVLYYPIQANKIITNTSKGIWNQ
ncbi:MAG: oligosaccharide flippase family protein [Saprospiraceae bacterium]|nr:oligosaccharide flippase family protein [Candidatus Brachybacter algidus]